MNTCKGCTHAHTGPIDKDTVKAPLVCRRYPPVTKGMLTQQGTQFVTLQPTVDPKGFCSEYQKSMELATLN